MIWSGKSREDPFQVILDRRIEKFSYKDSHDKLRSGMTKHQEWMLSVGIRFSFHKKAPGLRFYDVSTKSWDVGCKWLEFRANVLLIPEDLHLKTVVLGYLP